MIYVFGLAFAAAIFLACQIKKAPLNSKQNSVHLKVTNLKVTSRKPAEVAANVSNASLRSKPRISGFGQRTRDL
jgi:hypothetical protein